MLVSAGLRHLSLPIQQLGAGVKLVHQKLGEHMLMTLQGMRTIRAYGQEEVHQKRFEHASTQARQVALRLARLSALVSPLTEVGYLAVLFLVIAFADMWGIGFATSLTAVALLYRLQPHMRDLEGNLLYMAQIEPQLRSIRHMLSTDDKEYPKAGHVAVAKLENGISFRNVTFRYDAGTEPALLDVSFDIPAGKTTALIGASGAGKTTIVNLLLRLYSANEGVIRVDGRSIEDVRRTDWLDMLAIAGQDVDLVEGTVIENVRMAKNDASEEEVRQALRVAGISEVVEGLPDKYDTWIGQHGLRFPGGQRHCRAIVRNPKFLILDEAFASAVRRMDRSSPLHAPSIPAPNHRRRIGLRALHRSPSQWATISSTACPYWSRMKLVPTCDMRTTSKKCSWSRSLMHSAKQTI
ncbi:ATP-binding cassette domain-containing protein [Bradyrhizobium zhanjiangense]|uniref:ATP-binding cassette domain-containing protein n=1 Tax=Bradyrhizobium zhanjiangense TaxID=1325107 RepID=UPI0019D6C91C|nr:ABC transporter ATP-binding protein [Bradyrhizobium zhanjiangense]